ncbi:hypothetical protein T05_4666 [Trichinella murrelli]|uniref:Uncharacterized protein n=1 Tax=Trichinella murrelli TaxID=144512 RepID=A0A0V0TKU6_9BILA|nr:hypothetical protein T05_4666 [Trichinella murrelli]
MQNDISLETSVFLPIPVAQFSSDVRNIFGIIIHPASLIPVQPNQLFPPLPPSYPIPSEHNL